MTCDWRLKSIQNHRNGNKVKLTKTIFKIGIKFSGALKILFLTKYMLSNIICKQITSWNSVRISWLFDESAYCTFKIYVHWKSQFRWSQWLWCERKSPWRRESWYLTHRFNIFQALKSHNLNPLFSQKLHSTYETKSIYVNVR